MDFKAKSLTIDEIILPMRSIANLTDKSKVKEAVKILDVNHTKADLQAVVTNCTQLNSVEKNKLLGLHKNGVTPYHGRAFRIPKVHKDVIMKEIQRLCDLGVLEWH